MKKISFFLIALMLSVSAFSAQELQKKAPSIQSSPSPLQQIPSAKLQGSVHFTVWGFAVYDAKLWTGAEFDAAHYAQHPLALELSYLRDFTGHNIAKQSIKEMKHLGSLSDEQAKQWMTQLEAVIPNVKKGDKILGLHQPGRGAQFWLNGIYIGQIESPQFSNSFFGIWLSPKTSQPSMREKLLNQPSK